MNSIIDKLKEYQMATNLYYAYKGIRRNNPELNEYKEIFRHNSLTKESLDLIFNYAIIKLTYE